MCNTPNLNYVGLVCPAGSGSIGGGGGGGGDPTECETKVTVSACTYLVTSYSAWYLASSTTTIEVSPNSLFSSTLIRGLETQSHGHANPGQTDCATKTACNGKDTSFKTMPGVPACTRDPDVASAINADAAADRTQINGVDIPKDYWPTNPAGYDGSKFTLTQFGLSETITTTVQTTTTKTVVVPKVASTKCDYRYVPLPTHLSISPFLHYIHHYALYIDVEVVADQNSYVLSFLMFRVYKIDGWADDGGASLKKEEKGCGALTGWDFEESRTDWGRWAYFQLPVFMEAGCAERAIVSAGGSKLSCKYVGDGDWTKDNPRRRDMTPNTLPSNSTDTGDMTDPYTPIVWSPDDTLTLTVTIDVLMTSTYTTEIYLATYVEPESSTETKSLTTGTMTSGPITTAATTTGTTAPATTGPVSPGGSCGGADGYICLGTKCGDCCSAYGFCGSSTSHCIVGCQNAFGTCDQVSNKVSPDGSCGGPNGYVCAGSGFGDCCSAYGYCGSTSDHCGAGCQGEFGTC